MIPERVARSSLRWDAAYCAIAGSMMVVFGAPLSAHLGLASWFTVMLGFGVIFWAGIVWGMARAGGWWGPTAAVAAVNLPAAVVLAIWAAGTDGAAGAVLGLAAAQVLGFGAVQAVAVVTGWSERVG